MVRATCKSHELELEPRTAETLRDFYVAHSRCRVEVTWTDDEGLELADRAAELYRGHGLVAGEDIPADDGLFPWERP